MELKDIVFEVKLKSLDISLAALSAAEFPPSREKILNRYYATK